MIQMVQGDARCLPLSDASVQCCVTSPPYYGLRDYGVKGQLGLEPSIYEYVANLVAVFREIRRVLKPRGTAWLNLGDSYTGGGNYRGTNEATLTTKQRSNRGAHGQLAIGRGVQPPALKVEGLAAKNLLGMPWRVAFALQADGWILRSDIIWAKPNPMPESTGDRPTKSHEHLFLLTKQGRYDYNADAIKEPYAPKSFGRYQYKFGGAKNEAVLETGIRTHGVIGLRPYHGQATKDYDGAKAQNPSDSKRRILKSMETRGGRNKRDVWTIVTQPYRGAHFATFPEKLVEPCILAGSREGDLVLDPFAGSGTVGVVAARHNRSFIGLELNSDYIQLANRRLHGTTT